MKKNNKQKKLYIKDIAITGVFLAVILVFQTLRVHQIVTGVIINAVFIIVFNNFGFRPAVQLALLTPIGGALFSILAPALIPLLPVIAISNVLMIYLYKLVNKKNIFIKVAVPALSKSVFIFITGYFIINFFDTSDVLHKIFMFFSSVQFLTSSGGILLGQFIKLKKL
ncbi:MAG: hypothetical protein ACQESP_13175 [Candidatus Muiribacteriota bacterium]